MKYSFRAVLVALAMSVFSLAARAVEATWDYAVQVTASVQASPAQITLSWTQDTTATPSSYTVYRKAAGAAAWGSGTTLPGSTTTYTDTSVSAGTAYEYQVIKAASSYSGYGYVQAGIDLPLVENRGKMILVVDATMATPLAAELSRLQDDLAGDGWTVIRHDVTRTAPVTNVKSQIQSDYNADSANVKGVFLFGHVPVPYSGQLNPDGHPDHVGAWPADAFYGDMDGSWTDSSVNSTQTVNTDPADAARLTNVPGDGKFDQTTLPSAIELQVGRVDLANMPGRTSWNSPATFPSETELLRQYLKKDHEYRHRIMNIQRRAIVGDYFGVRSGEAFAASGYRNFAPLVGSDKITNLNTQYNDQHGVEIPALVAGDYLFAYGCGAGSYTAVSGLGNVGQYNDCDTVELVSNDVHAAFFMLFGSWFGDWDHEDSMLRAPLATKTNGLVSVWSGRPHWFFHPLGLGDTFGAVARLTQNNSGLYRNQINNSANLVHAALMGDPSLRLYPVAPPASFGGTAAGSVVTLTWAPSPDSVLGYHIYRATSAAGPFTRLTPSLLGATAYVDASAPTGAVYMVRAVKKETSPSGSFYNASQGLFWKVGGSTGPVVTVDPTAPTVAVSAPAAGATLTGSAVTVSANASDNVGVVGVQFLLDGNNVGGEVTAAPFNLAWNSTAAANGPHTLAAIARDLAGNRTTSPAVTVTVGNTTAGGGSDGAGSSSAWVDDAIPAGATGSGTNGDGWNWVTSSPAPFNGSKAHQSNLVAGLHEHSFSWASATMPVATGDTMFAYIYLDPANPPTEVMMSWVADNWEHRAYWGGNSIQYGSYGSASRHYVGPLPAIGQWVRLEVPAAAVGLEGQTVTGMSFSLFDGRATWDYAGHATTSATPPPVTPPTGSGDVTAPIVSMSRPQLGVTVSGTAVGVLATASDNVGVAGVQFLLDGANLGAEVASAPYSYTWNSTTTTNGHHTVGAIARDAAGNKTTALAGSVTVSNTTSTPPAGTGGGGTTTPPVAGNLVNWFDDALPAGAGGSGTGGDTWNWVTSSPTPNSGSKAHQSSLAAGLHEHSFNWATDIMKVATGDTLVAYVYLDPANPPTEVMISWGADSWEHRAYWGANSINYGTDGTASRRKIGALPTAGQWVRLEVPAALVGLEGKSVTGMSFSLFGGRATWDNVGRATAATSTGGTGSGTTTTPGVSTAWFDDALPAGAGGSGSGGDTWNWVTSSPAPFSGTKAHQSAIAAGLHEHAFNWATTAMNVATGATLYAYIYLDPANPPTEVMISWGADSWEHRAYWGGNSIPYGSNGTASRRYIGALPATGQWVRLEVPAASVGLEGQSVQGMSFSLWGGRATWDVTGTATASSGSTSGSTSGSGSSLPTVTMVATDPTATLSSVDNGAFTFTRTGSTTSPLTVKFAVAGTAVKWIDYRRPEGDMPVEFTIPAGSASGVMNIAAMDNVTNANPETAVITLSPDAAYTVGAQQSGTLAILSTGSTGGLGGSGSTGSGGTGTGTGGTGTGTGTGGTGTGGTVDATASPVNIVDYTKLQIPAIGSNLLHVLSPTTLELVRINTAPAGGAVDSWNFVDGAGNFTAPANNKFNVTVNNQVVAVQSIGFKRRPLYAPLVTRDLRIASSLVLQLASPVADGQTVEVKNADGTLWPTAMIFKTVAEPVRYSPAIHVNQEGYVPSLPKKAAVGYYLGNLGEMTVSNLTFSIVDAVSGAVAYQGTLVARPDSGWTYSPTPYQKVYEADFSNFTTVGEYKLVVPGLGASLPFLVDDGIGMAFARTYAQGLYHQRCGLPNELPYTRFTHDACHTAPATIPVSTSGFSFTWTTIATYANSLNTNNPVQTAPALTSPAAQLYPFVNQGSIDVSGGHHDAGDYSKYTINSASLLHTLMFAVDSLNGVAALDNLGLPESGDGISDVMQEAKLEADYLSKLQDADGGFYFLVYPHDREYENNVLPDHGDPQVVWPKNTAATAAAVAALAEAASSPRLKAAYPQAAAAYLTKAKAGWQFLTNAIAKYGKAGAYQKITHYGDDFTHDDELAWAAAAMFVATGDASIHATLKSWYDPADPATWRWGWWHAFMGWGNAVRTYAFAARSGRLSAGQLDAAYLAKCETEVRAAGDAALKWSQQSAYGTSFPEDTKHVQAAGWYFSGSQSFDLAVARQLDARADYLDAIVRNLNYEGGSNAINVTYVTGLGWKRQKEIVHQYAQNDDRVLPPNGIPLGNLQTGPVYTGTYGTDLAALSFPRDDAGTAPHGFYDRWSDTFNVTTEFVVLDQARGLASFAYLASLTPAKSQAWKSAPATITGIPATPAAGTPITVGLQVAGMDLEGARIVWEAKGQPASYGETYTFTPAGFGAQWVEAEAQWPDGRRAVARATLFAENGLPTVTVAATDATATIANAADTAIWTFTRTGSTASAITVNFKFNGTAAKWTDYRRPEGDMPETVTIPAGAASATLTVRAMANSTNANPETAVLSLLDGTGYNVGTVYSATVTLH